MARYRSRSRVWAAAVAGAQFALLPVAIGQPARSTSSGEFHRIWYSEVVLGDIEGAAGRYFELYTSAPSKNVSPLDRERAAFRAGLCFEVLGDTRLAKLAYEWLLERGRSGTKLRQRTSRRLNALNDEIRRRGGGSERGVTESSAAAEHDSAAGGSADLAVLPLPSSSDPALQDVLADLDRSIRQRTESFAKARTVFRTAELRAQALSDLLAWLRREGVDMAFEARESRNGGLVDPLLDLSLLQERLRGLLGGSPDWIPFNAYLGNRLFENALKFCVQGELAPSRGDLAMALAVLPSHRGAVAFRQLLAELSSRSSLARLARRRLEEQLEMRTAEVRQELRRALERVSDSSRRDRVLRELEAARRLVEWTPRHALLDPEVSWLVETLRHAFTRAGDDATVDYLEALWRRGRHEVRRFLNDLEVWIGHLREEQRSTGRPVWSADVAARAIAGRMLKELERLRASSEDEDLQKKFHYEIQFLKGWFPADGGTLLRPQLEVIQKPRGGE